MKSTEFQTNEKKSDPDISHNFTIIPVAFLLLLFQWKYALHAPTQFVLSLHSCLREGFSHFLPPTSPFIGSDNRSSSGNPLKIPFFP